VMSSGSLKIERTRSSGFRWYSCEQSRGAVLDAPLLDGTARGGSVVDASVLVAAQPAEQPLALAGRPFGGVGPRSEPLVRAFLAAAAAPARARRGARTAARTAAVPGRAPGRAFARLGGVHDGTAAGSARHPLATRRVRRGVRR